MAAKFEKYTGSDLQFYFRLTSGTGDIILQSEGCATPEERDAGIAAVKVSAESDKRYERSQTIRGTWFFNLRSDNHKVAGTSQMYETNAEMEAGINEVRSLAVSAVVIELNKL